MTLSEIRRPLALSDRAQEFPESPIRKLTPLAEAAKRRGTKVYHLNIGQPDIETPACMRDRLKQMDARVLEYSPSAGTPEYLQSLQHYYERQLGMSLRPAAARRFCFRFSSARIRATISSLSSRFTRIIDRSLRWQG